MTAATYSAFGVSAPALRVHRMTRQNNTLATTRSRTDRHHFSYDGYTTVARSEQRVLARYALGLTDPSAPVMRDCDRGARRRRATLCLPSGVTASVHRFFSIASYARGRWRQHMTCCAS